MTETQNQSKDREARLRKRGLTQQRELHIKSMSKNQQTGVTKYLVEVWQTFRGNRRCIRTFPVHGNSIERIQRRFMSQYKCYCVIDHTADEVVPRDAQGRAVEIDGWGGEEE